MIKQKRDMAGNHNEIEKKLWEAKDQLRNYQELIHLKSSGRSVILYINMSMIHTMGLARVYI
ncbi:MAG: hypothetical protein N3D15_06710 [Syntrophorhabdaceae bacterium]|nr:hypothetical protein [Syntrophorhabdaceae bacterium]